VNSPSGAAPVTVTSTGFNGSGFYPGSSGNLPSATNNSGDVVAETPPQPTINLLNGTTNSPFAGQLISLSVSAPSGWTLNSESWSFGNLGDVVAGYNASATSGAVVPISSISTTAATLPNYYYIVPGQSETVTVQVKYTLADGSASSSVSTTQTFNVQGPTGTFQPLAYLQTDASGTVIGTVSSSGGCTTTLSTPQANPACLGMGNAPQPNPGVGVWFKESMSPPQANPGRFIWVQILNSVTNSQISSPNSGYTPPGNALNQLDGLYPYPSNADVAASQPTPTNAPSNYASDAPARTDLSGILGEAAKSFDATMYVLWDPLIPPTGQSSCTGATVNTSTKPYTVTPSQCASIPVPLGAIDWTWSACAINALAPAGTGAHTNSWVVQCGVGSQTTYETSDYPKWGSCFKSTFGGC
jgi:hypothetical protein